MALIALIFMSTKSQKKHTRTDLVFKATPSCPYGQLRSFRLHTSEQLYSSCINNSNGVQALEWHSCLSALYLLSALNFPPHTFCLFFTLLSSGNSSSLLLPYSTIRFLNFSIDCSRLMTPRSKKWTHTSEPIAARRVAAIFWAVRRDCGTAALFSFLLFLPSLTQWALLRYESLPRPGHI